MRARYSDLDGRLREVLTRPGSGGSVLLIDRDVLTRGDRRLVAHLAADEPPLNAVLACKDYLAHHRHRRCRPLTPEDLSFAPFADGPEHESGSDQDPDHREVFDRHGCSYRLLPAVEGIAIPELRWHRFAPTPASAGTPAPVSSSNHGPLSLREVIASLESYQPMRDITARELARPQRRRVSIFTLRCELERVNVSPIVLNRGLREAVVRVIAQGDSMSEITIRCGRFKRDGGGGVQGDTSWLARRIGLVPNAGKTEPTPWVHSDVLALIARRGLGISPREVELG